MLVNWHQGTKGDRDFLYSRLVTGEALLIDDHGCWDNIRRSVDAYFADRLRRMLLNCIDGTSRIAVKF